MTNLAKEIVIESFFDLYEKYLELQYAVELCKPYFDLPQGKAIIDDILAAASEYGLRGERLADSYTDILGSQEVLKRMGASIANLDDRIKKIQISPMLQEHADAVDKEFRAYILDALTRPHSSQADTETHEWLTRMQDFDRRELYFRDIETRERHGVAITWSGGRIFQIDYNEHDVTTFTIHVYDTDKTLAIKYHPPAQVELTDKEPLVEEKTERSDLPWGSVLAGTMGGLLLSSMLLPKEKSKKVLEKVDSQYKMEK